MRTLTRMKVESNAEVVLSSGSEKPASPVTSYGFIVTFGSESFSAAVVPNGSGTLKAEKASRVRLQFLVPEAARFLKPGAEFTFFEDGRSGHGRVI
jgi:hypothetical protein